MRNGIFIVPEKVQELHEPDQLGHLTRISIEQTDHRCVVLKPRSGVMAVRMRGIIISFPECLLKCRRDF